MLIIGFDAHAHHHTPALTKVAGTCNKPSFVNRRRWEVIGITVGITNKSKYVRKWNVSDEEHTNTLTSKSKVHILRSCPGEQTGKP